MKDFKKLREDARDPRSMTKQSLSRIVNTPGHPMSSAAKDELARRHTQNEGGMKRMATTQSNKADRMASTDKKGLETFKKKPATEAKVNELKTSTMTSWAKKVGPKIDRERNKVKAALDQPASVKHAEAGLKAMGRLKAYSKSSDTYVNKITGRSKVKPTPEATDKAYEQTIAEAGPRHTMTSMKDRFGGAVDSKKFGTYKAHMKKHNLDEPTVRMIHQNPDAAESKRMMKNPKYVQAVSLYKDAQRKESVDLTKIRTMLDKE